MSDVISPLLARRQRLARLFHSDFCPSLNRYVYWMKEPIGWFAAAAFVSLLVGAFLSPLGWALAAGLLAIIAGGLLFPLLAVRFAQCKIEPLIQELHEGEESELLLTITNPLPMPLWGLTINGYLTDLEDTATARAEGGSLRPEICLSSVPMLSSATFRLPIKAAYRGRYPLELPQIACAFPFAIWTARRQLTDVKSVTVWPMLIRLTNLMELGGRRTAEIGFGNRPGTHGDFLGVRRFRRGDALRSIHWVQSARTGELVVCERAAPQQQEVLITVETDYPSSMFLSRLEKEEKRENLAWRIRIAASLVELLDARRVPVSLQLGMQGRPTSALSMAQAFEYLTDVPLDGESASQVESLASQEGTRSHAVQILLAGVGSAKDLRPYASDLQRYISMQMVIPGAGRGEGEKVRQVMLDLDRDIPQQLEDFLREVGHVSSAA